MPDPHLPSSSTQPLPEGGAGSGPQRGAAPPSAAQTAAGASPPASATTPTGGTFASREVLPLADAETVHPVTAPGASPSSLGPVGTGGAGATAATNKIRSFGERRRHEDSWTRTPNTTGNGAIHVKTFHSKLTDEAMTYLDQTINEWLDAHPQYEVKFTSTSIGDFTGKLKEPHLIVSVWV